MFGLPAAEYDKLAAAHRRAVIFKWFAAGYIYIAISGNIFSWESGLLLFPGIFIAAALAFITFLIAMALKRRTAMLDFGASAGKFLFFSAVTLSLVALFVAEVAAAVLFVQVSRKKVAIVL